MNAPGINSAAPPTGNRPQRPSLLPVNPSASASSGAASSAGSGSSSALALGSAGAAGQSSGHIPSQSPVQTEAGQAQSQAATSPSSTSAGTYMQRSRRRWTAEEDEKLISAVKAYGSARGPGSAWSLISQGIPGRTNKDCRKRWFHSLDPSVRKGKWSPNEDDALRKLYSELGPQWKEIALRIPGRKDDQVSKRWRDVLAPELTSKKPWSGKEDALLLELLEKLGPRWTAIADKLPGRSPIACRNRSRKFRKQRPEAMADDTPSSTGASGSGSQSGSGVASAGQSTVPLPSMTSMASAVEDEPDWRLPTDLNPSISVSSFNFDLNQNRLATPGPQAASQAQGSAGPQSTGPNSAGPGGPAGPGGQGPGGQGGQGMMNDSVMTMASPAVNTSALPMSHDSVSPTTHMDQPLPQMEGGWMQPPTPMQMGMPLFDRAVDDMWSLFVALDRGDSAVLVDSNLLRQLVAGVASGIGHPQMQGRA